MADYSSPIRRKSTYSSPSSRSFINHPPPEGSLRDTTINVATAFSNAEQRRSRSPQLQSSLSNNTSFLGNKYILSPSQRISNLKNHSILVDSDNVFSNGQIKPLDLYGNQLSSLSQSSSSDDDMDDNPYEEEELLARNPSEEEHRRGLVQQRSSTSDRFFSNYGGSIAGSSFHSLGDNNNNTSIFNELDHDDYGNIMNGTNNNYTGSHQRQQSTHTSKSSPSTRPRIQFALERTFEIIMFWIFMVFWVIKEIAVALFTFIFILVSSLLVNPIVFLLQLIGFKSLEPLELPQLKSSLTRGGDTGATLGEEHQSRLLTTYSLTRKVAILAVVTFGCFYWFSSMSDNSAPNPSSWQQSFLLDHLYNKFTPSPSVSSWFSSIPTNVQNGMKPSTPHYDLAMKERFATLEKTVHGLITHVEKQDQSSQQQIKAINYHLNQLQQQLSQWSSGQSIQLESSLMEQMEKVEKVLATTTTEWTARLQQHMDQHYTDVDVDDGAVSPKLLDALGQLFVSKSDHDYDWDTFLQHHKAELDQHLHDMMDQWIRNQRQQGTWVDKDTLNETLMAHLMHAYNNNNNNNNSDDDSNPMLTPETNMMIRGLIDTAIQKYHQDVLGTPDYALATRGAMVLAPYTSSTFMASDGDVGGGVDGQGSSSSLRWWTRWYSQWSHAHISPVVALTPGTHAGQCWPMKGDHGSLGIRLSEPIAVQSVTMEYPSRSVVANHISSAPKEFEIWGIKDIDEEFKTKKTQQNKHWTVDNDTNMIFLGSFTYDIKSSSSPSPVQTFSLDTNRYIVLQGVVVRVRSNWGNPLYTCLYRVRVHGTPAV